MQYEEAEKNLKSLIERHNGPDKDLNEADTRFKLIDELFIKSLGWDKNQISLEERDTNTGKYLDYVFSDVQKLMIVEAKREGMNFNIPVGTKPRSVYLLPSLCRADDNLKNSVEQVLGYCNSNGVQVGVVTNGHQLIAFIASRQDGQPPLGGGALVFSSLEAMSNNFIELWQSLSIAGIKGNHLYQILTKGEISDLPQKLSQETLGYLSHRERTDFQKGLKNSSEFIFQDVITEPTIESDFYKYCYYKTGDVSKYNLTSREILETRYTELSTKGVQITKLNSLVDNAKSEIKSSRELLTRRPIIIIGDKDVGKTSFIKNFINVEAKDILNEYINLYIDLQIQANLERDLRIFIPSEIARQLNENYGINIEEQIFLRGVYRKELEEFPKTIYGSFKKINPTKHAEEEIKFLCEKIKNRDEHLRRSLKHMIERKNKNIVIFLDNADQRNEEDQHQAFLIAQELALEWQITIFVAMRPEVYALARERGLTKDYYPTVYYIQPPPIDEVIKKRLEFALKLTKGEIKVSSLPENARVELGNLESLIKIQLYAIENQNEIKEFFENICAGDVTLSLNLLKESFSNPYIDQEGALDHFSKSGRPLIRFHEFMRAAIFGDFNYYQPDKSPMANIFDVSTSDGKEHFMVALLLGCLNRYSENKNGFIELRTIYEDLQSLGFKPHQINNAVSKCLKEKLVEAHKEIDKDGGSTNTQISMLRINSRGVYHLKILPPNFEYVDAIVMDTPILDDDKRIQIIDARTLEERIKRGAIFCEYLDTEWEHLDNPLAHFDWKSGSLKLKSRMDEIKGKLS
ncbi:MAG: hypothetical protein M1312_01105 [Patescibacteria group bacterium]|nr:hypothetical protein [Patescibacteria group bacterium]